MPNFNTQFLGNKFLFLRSENRYEIFGTRNSRIIVHHCKPDFLSINVILHGYLKYTQHATTLEDAVQIAECYARRHSKIFASNRIDAAWRNEKIYSFQEIVSNQLKHKGIAIMPTAGKAAEEIGKALAR